MGIRRGSLLFCRVSHVLAKPHGVGAKDDHRDLKGQRDSGGKGLPSQGVHCFSFGVLERSRMPMQAMSTPKGLRNGVSMCGKRVLKRNFMLIASRKFEFGGPFHKTCNLKRFDLHG